MGQARKYITFKSIRMSLFQQTYSGYVIAEYIRNKYKKKSKFPKGKKIPEISLLVKCLNFDFQPTCDFIVKNKRLPLMKLILAKSGIRQYLEVEKELVRLVSSRHNRSKDFYDPDYEIEVAILQLSIERVSGNHVPNNTSDRDFENILADKQNQYRKWYYKIAYLYKLPTIRITPFILRLIKS